MVAVEVVFDLSRLLAPDPATVPVEGPSDYVPACLSLRERLHTPAKSPGGPPLKLLVHEPTVAAWLRSFAQGYGDTRVRTREYTARQALAERWSVSVPPDVVDSDILASRLLDEELTARPGQSFDDLVLERFYSAPMAYPRFPIDLLVPLMNAFDAQQWLDSTSRPLIAATFRRRLNQWAAHEPNDARQEIISRLGTDPADLHRDLCLFTVLQGYPTERVDRVLGATAQVFRKAGVDTTGLSLRSQDLTPARREVEYYLHDIEDQVNTIDDARSLLAMMSGVLVVEFTTIEDLLEKHPDFATAEFVDQVDRRFNPLRDALSTRLARLRRLIAPPAPPPPTDAWAVDEWLHWVRDDYMPYYRWLEGSGRQDDQVASYAVRFADWYFSHYIELKHGAPTHFAFCGLQLERERIRTGDRVTLVLLLDNFSYAFFDELKRLFSQHDLWLAEDKPMLSLIPTATPIGKPSLICGEGDQTELISDDYATLVESSWGPLLGASGKSAAYLSSVGELRDLRERKHDLYVLNYLPVDTLLHEVRQKLGQDHCDLVYGALEELVRTVAEFARRFQITERLQVLATADHGCTRIGREVVNVLDKRFFRKLAIDRHHRFIEVSDEQLKDRPQMVDQQCYVLDRKWFGTRENYFVARGYYRFAETTDDFYVHGGLTPEEVVVPFARFEVSPLQVLPPDVSLLSDQFRYAVKSAVKLELRNPNSYPLETIEVRLRGVASDSVTVPRLGPKASVQVEMPAIFRREPGVGNTRELVAQVRYDCQAHQFSPIEVPFTITLKTMMEVKDDFDF